MKDRREDLYSKTREESWKGIGWQEDEITVGVGFEWDARGASLSALQTGMISDWGNQSIAQCVNSYRSTLIEPLRPSKAPFDTNFSPIDSPLPRQTTSHLIDFFRLKQTPSVSSEEFSRLIHHFFTFSQGIATSSNLFTSLLSPSIRTQLQTSWPRLSRRTTMACRMKDWKRKLGRRGT